MKRVVSLFLGVAFIAAPVFAQGRPPTVPGGGGVQELASQLAALQARVAKLEGNIVAADLAGTYSVTLFGTNMNGARAVPPRAATINTIAGRGTLTLNADGTGTIASLACEGSEMVVATGAMHGVDCSEPDSEVTWTYAEGVATVTFLGDGDQLPFNVSLGGRYLTVAFAPFHPSEPGSDHVLIIATRLK